MNNHTLCNIKKCFTILLCTGLLASCNNASDNAEGLSDSQIEIHGDTLTIPSSSTIASRIVCDTVGESSYAATLTTTGVVTAIPSSYAEVAAPFGGRVVRSLVRIGQKVKAGTPCLKSPPPIMAKWSNVSSRLSQRWTWQNVPSTAHRTFTTTR